jgi:tetratricopeptide (TPR) repeat protein
MKKDEDIKKIKELIQKDEIEKALNSLDGLFQDNDSLKEILFQKGRFSNLLRSDRLGVVSPNEANLERNKIRKSIIDLITEWENNRIPKSNQDKLKDFFNQNKIFAFRFFLITTLIVVGFFMTNNYLKTNIDKSKYVQLGNEKYNAEEWKDAIFYYDALAEAEPQNIYFFERKGYCNYGLKRYKQALIDFNKAISIAQIEKFPQLLFYRGNTNYRLEDYDSAIADFNKLLEIQPKHLNATNQRGLSYIGLEKKDEACNDFERVYKFGVPKLKSLAKRNIDKYCK